MQKQISGYSDPFCQDLEKYSLDMTLKDHCCFIGLNRKLNINIWWHLKMREEQILSMSECKTSCNLKCVTTLLKSSQYCKALHQHLDYNMTDMILSGCKASFDQSIPCQKLKPYFKGFFSNSILFTSIWANGKLYLRRWESLLCCHGYWSSLYGFLLSNGAHSLFPIMHQSQASWRW